MHQVDLNKNTMTTRFASLQKLILLSHIKVGKIDVFQWESNTD